MCGHMTTTDSPAADPSTNGGSQRRGFGVDVGGSGVKGGVVDLDTGLLIGERFKLATPQPATPDAVMRQWFKEVWNEQNEEAIDRLMAPDAVAHGLGGEPLRGPEAFKAFWRAFQGALSQLNVEVTHVTTEGEMAVAHCHVTGRHTGDTLGVPSTGRDVDFWGFTRARIVNGRIVEGWNTFDFLTCYQQMGLLPQLAV